MPATADPDTERLLAFATRRRAPEPSIERLDPSDWPAPAAQAAALVWSRRVQSEADSVVLAEALAGEIDRAGLGTAPLTAAIARLAEDERRHVAIASSFVARLGAPPPPLESTVALPDDDPASLAVLRCVLTGLAVCETVSAVRFATVRAHTDVLVARACIELFLRDEIAHARLGFLLLPRALALHAQAVGDAAAAATVASELRSTFRHLDRVVGLDAERRGIALERRAQPRCNPGIVEPVLDAIALREAVDRTLVPRLARLGIDAAASWADRWSR